MLDRMVEKARQQEVFSCEDTPMVGVSSRRFCTMLPFRIDGLNRSLIGRMRRSDSGFID